MINHLYIIDTDILNDESVFNNHYKIMTENRKMKIDSFRFLKDKKLSLGAGILMREAFIREGIQFQDSIINYNEYKKPYLFEKHNFYYNLSHSGKYAVCAVSDRNTGVDIEEIQHFDENIVKQIYLSNEIRSAVSHCSSPDHYYTILWTIKESVMKYYGTGLSLEPKKINIISNDPFKVSCDGFDTSLLHIKQYDIPGYSLTVCSEYSDFTDHIEWINNL